MAGLLAMVGGLGGALSIGGTVLSAVGAIQQGNAQKAAGEYQAKQLEAAGKAEQATAIQAANEERRQKEFAISRARTVAAASGGGQDLALMEDIEEDGELRAQTKIWQGNEAAAGRNAQAAAARFEGSQYKKAGFINAMSTVAKGGASFYEKFG